MPLLSSVTLSSLDLSPRDEMALDSKADMSGIGRRRRDFPLADVEQVEDSPSFKLADESIPSLLLRGSSDVDPDILPLHSEGIVGMGSRTSIRF